MWGSQDLSAVLPEGGGGLLDQLAHLRSALSLTQHTRLLQLRTALPEGMLIPERCTVHEALHAERPFQTELDCVSLQSSIALGSLMGTVATLQLRLQDGGWRAWHGHVAQASHVGSDGGLSRYRLQLRDFTHWASLRRDTRIFQDQTAADIVQAVLMAHPQARVRLELSQPGPVRAITTQYRETDWAFAQRLMASEGWSWRIEHDPSDAHASFPGADASHARGAGQLLAPARHTLVVFDATSTRPNLGALRFSRPGMRGATLDGLAQDTLTAWAPARGVGTNAITLAAWDERRVAGVASSSQVPDEQRPAAVPVLEHYQGAGERHFANGRVADAQHGAPDVAQARAQAWLDAQSLAQHVSDGAGAVRALSVGATFTLSGHFANGATGGQAFSVIGITHEAANNLGVRAAPLGAATDAATAAATQSTAGTEAGTYRNRFQAAPAHLRLVPPPHAAPPSPGLQTAVVMTQHSGANCGAAPVHSDRDGRIRVQFPWQRGADGEQPLQGGLATTSSPTGHANGHAPGDARSGTWVRVLQDQAGPDWGAVFTPRPGTEVLVDFIDGDIDRPIVIGQLHNGIHALPWPAGEGSQANHAGSLSGWHHPLLDDQGGTSGANQWLIDDSQGQLRMRLLSYSASHGHSELSLGHLVQHSAQHDAQGTQARRGHWLGEGFYGHTEGWAVVRAGQGLLLSTAARTAQGASVVGTQMDTAEAVGRLRAARQLGQTLSQSAHQQSALGLGSHDADGMAWSAHTDAIDPQAQGKLPASLNGQDARQAQPGSRALQDPVEAFAHAALHLDTPSSAALVSAAHLSIFSGQDTSLSTQGDAHLTAAHTLSAVSGQTTSLYTHAGGIQAIAAHASLSLRAHTDAQQLSAQRDITVQSTTDEVRIQASQRITLSAGQSQIVIEGGNITFTCPGAFTVKGATHEWGGGGSQSALLQQLPEELSGMAAIASPLAQEYGLEVDVGAFFAADPELQRASVQVWSTGEAPRLLGHGRLNAIGRSELVHSTQAEQVEVVIGEGEWFDIEDVQPEEEDEA